MNSHVSCGHLLCVLCPPPQPAPLLASNPAALWCIAAVHACLRSLFGVYRLKSEGKELRYPEWCVPAAQPLLAVVFCRESSTSLQLSSFLQEI